MPDYCAEALVIQSTLSMCEKMWVSRGDGKEGGRESDGEKKGSGEKRSKDMTMEVVKLPECCEE